MGPKYFILFGKKSFDYEVGIESLNFRPYFGLIFFLLMSISLINTIK